MLAFEPAAGSGLRGTGVDPRNIAGQDLAPKVEFKLPVGTRACRRPRAGRRAPSSASPNASALPRGRRGGPRSRSAAPPQRLRKCTRGRCGPRSLDKAIGMR